MTVPGEMTHMRAEPTRPSVSCTNLAGAAVEKIIPETVADLARFDLDRIVPGHCTGWRAVNALVEAFGDKVVDPCAVGRAYSF